MTTIFYRRLGPLNTTLFWILHVFHYQLFRHILISSTFKKFQWKCVRFKCRLQSIEIARNCCCLWVSRDNTFECVILDHEDRCDMKGQDSPKTTSSSTQSSRCSNGM